MIDFVSHYLDQQFWDDYVFPINIYILSTNTVPLLLDEKNITNLKTSNLYQWHRKSLIMKLSLNLSGVNK